MASGIKIVAEIEGTGAVAEKGDAVAFECAALLNKGSEVHPRRRETVVLGSRRFIAGIEAALIGMREGGYRKVRIAPHLAYRATGVEAGIPPNAALVYELWLRSVQKRTLSLKPGGTRARGARTPRRER